MHATLTSCIQPVGRFLKKERVRGYRFGFNGKEKVDEVYGDANAYDFGARIYDPRLGRFLSVDPMAAKYPAWSPFSFAINNPIRFIDENGNGPGDGLRRTYTTVVEIETSKGVYETVYLAKRYYENVTTEQAETYKREAQTPNGWYMISKAEYEAQHGREGRETSTGRIIGAKDPNPNALTERVNGADTPKKRVDFVNNAAQGDYMDGQPLALTNRTGTATLNMEGSVDANGNPVTETISFSILDAAGNVLSSQQVTITGPGEIKFDFNLKEGELVSFSTTATQDDRGWYVINATTRGAKGDDRAPDTIGDYGTEEPTDIDINAIKKKIK
jgi:RHS repeat-associated protein